MAEIKFHGRRAAAIENEHVRVTVTIEGGHIAEILHKGSGISPLWIPPWKSIEPSTYDPGLHPEYGGGAEAKLLSGIMGQNLCLDIFGGVTPEEEAAGLTVHGESSVAPYHVETSGQTLTQRTTLPLAQIAFERTIRLDGDRVIIRESAENLTAFDRPMGWTQHVTLGPPFLKNGKTQFRCPGTKSKVLEADFAGEAGYMKLGAEFDWPNVPLKSGAGTADLRTYTDRPASGAYSAHLMDPHREKAFWLAYDPESKVLIGYQWKRIDFPWLGIWEENRGRKSTPWLGRATTCGMEFGASPMPETRRQMVERGTTFGVPGYRWLPAKSKAVVEYEAFVRTSDRIPHEI